MTVPNFVRIKFLPHMATSPVGHRDQQHCVMWKTPYSKSTLKIKYNIVYCIFKLISCIWQWRQLHRGPELENVPVCASAQVSSLHVNLFRLNEPRLSGELISQWQSAIRSIATSLDHPLHSVPNSNWRTVDTHALQSLVAVQNHQLLLITSP